MGKLMRARSQIIRTEEKGADTVTRTSKAQQIYSGLLLGITAKRTGSVAMNFLLSFMAMILRKYTGPL